MVDTTQLEVLQSNGTHLPVNSTNPLPISGTITAGNTAGTNGHSSPVIGNPVRIGGKVVTAADITLVAGDVSDVMMTTAGQVIDKPFATAELDWVFVGAAGGIVNTATAVTVQAAKGASIRNYVTGLQVAHDTLGAVTELAIRDGAAGTVLWRGKLQTTANEGFNVQFLTPLKGSAATLLEIVTLTAVTGGVYVNLQGYSSF